MRTLLILASVASIAAPALSFSIVPTEASASASDCRAAATVGGAAGGALIGGGLAHGGTAGAVLGGLGGAVIGHEVARNNCKDKPRHYAVACRTATHYRDHRRYEVRECQGRDGVWRPA